MKVVIAGGGSTYTPGIVNAILHNENFKLDELVLYDNNSFRNERMLTIISTLVKHHKKHIRVSSTEDPVSAFTGAKCIFSQIRVGLMKMREQDEKIPIKYGLVGQETCGLGGLSYGLRSISGMLEIAGYVTKYAPDAWIFNYTNPEAIIADAVHSQYPDLKIVNACDMTISIMKAIADSLGFDFEGLTYEYFGLNHYGWFTKVYYEGKEISRQIIESIQKNGLKAPLHDQDNPSWVHTYEMVKNILVEFDELIPNTYLQYYLLPKEAMSGTDPKYTRANEVMDGREKNIQNLYEELKKGNEEAINSVRNTMHGGYIVDIADAVLHNKKHRAAIIVENKGIISNFRQDAFVEVLCEIEGESIKAVNKGMKINNFHKGMMESQNASEKLLIEGYYNNSYKQVLQAFLLNKTCPDMNTAKAVLDEFIKVNGDLYPELK